MRPDRARPPVRLPDPQTGCDGRPRAPSDFDAPAAASSTNAGFRAPRHHAGGTASRALRGKAPTRARRSEEHTSELQSLMRISYAVFCLKKKKKAKLM